MRGHFYLAFEFGGGRNLLQLRPKNKKDLDMCARIKPRNNGKRVPNSLIYRGIACFLVLAFLFRLLPSLTTKASANDLTLTDNLTITLDNRIDIIHIGGKIPIARNYQFNLFLSPGASNILSASPSITTTVSKRTEMPQTSGKLMIVGVVGKRILTVSAEMYDSDSHSWLRNGNLALGRGQSFSAIPFNGKVLAWAGMIVPF